MILKASQRGGAKQLGLHLLKTTENERVEIHEVRGFISDDVMEAMHEAYAVSLGTKCKQFLFSVSLNPPETENVRVEVFEQALAKIEERNGLTNQPRIVVFHEKEGRRHAHAVWSRIDAETMTANPLPHFKLKLRDVSKELYIENGWKMPRGFIDQKQRDPRNFTLDEWQQAKRHGDNARDMKALMQECWAASDSRQAFSSALQERGLYLARGDRRGHVAVTYDGEVVSVARMVGKPAKEVAARLGDPALLSSVEETRAHIAQHIEPKIKSFIAEAKEDFAARMKPVQQERLQMKALHDAERAKLDHGQAERLKAETQARAERLRKGLGGLWDRLTGEHAKIKAQNEMEAYWSLQRDREQRNALVSAQMRERQALQHKIIELRQDQAQRLRELHRDLHRYGELQRPKDRDGLSGAFGRTTHPRPKTAQERLNDLRSRKPKDRGRDFER
jgi:Relaxase/Mobilisation nuclease domain